MENMKHLKDNKRENKYAYCLKCDDIKCPRYEAHYTLC